MIKEVCHFRLLEKLSAFETPDWYCADKMVGDVGEASVTSFEPSISLVVGVFMMLAIGMFGVTLVELLNNKLDWYITPLVNRVNRRYMFVIERNRLRTMNGHP